MNDKRKQMKMNDGRQQQNDKARKIIFMNWDDNSERTEKTVNEFGGMMNEKINDEQVR